MLDVIPSKRLMAFALIIAVLSRAVIGIFNSDLVGANAANVLVIFFALANLAVGVAGLRTSQRIAWSAYLLVSVAMFFLLGFSTPIGALVILAPIAIELGIDFIRAAWRPW
ncbi:hypothetical protein HGO38_10640 [Rhizobium sp. CG5]|uniref:hypothetical protein n=1 Tax=Rhizobium sp. CG5 TaxID=2726076 RepID=UPI0020338BA4|nr:hypothetical protein [Rhizobium sp. CG5]MCM2473929.1 hypothetical protein [Rhizobium sp. CG5]